MASQKKKTALVYSGIGALLVAGILSGANVISHYAHVRLDFSRGRIFSLSEATKKIARGLPDPVTVTLYSSRELPPSVAALRNYTRDIMAEYQSASGGKVRARFAEVGDTPESLEDAAKNGILPVRFDIYSRDRFEQRQGCFGAVIQFRDKKEVLPYITETGSLEYEITSRLKSLAHDGKPVLGFVTDKGATAHFSLGPDINAQLNARYEPRAVDISKVDPQKGIAPEIKTLFFLGGTEPLDDKELFALDQYLLSGRTLFAAVDAARVNARAFAAMRNDTGMEKFLAAHGITILPEMAMDEQCQPIQISRRQGMFVLANLVRYPPFIVARELDKSNPALKDVPALIMPFASPVAISSAAAAGAARAETLVKTSPQSWLATYSNGGISLDPFGDFSRKDAEKGPFGLAVFLEKKFRPAFPAPKGVKQYLTQASGTGRLAVAGTSAFITGQYNLPDSNVMFFLNLADWLLQDSDLIAIRSKNISFRPLAEVSEAGKRAARYCIMLLPPLGAALIGLALWRRRRILRSRAAGKYGQ
ncbi:MAG: GldG family protein [Elusimicrobiales bacterium]